MNVIGVGFGRTGTASLRAALERLGMGPCYHMFDVIDRPARARHWLAAAQGTPPSWAEVFAGYQSTVDWPAAAFWRELMVEYPEAKLILTVRDPQRWYDSAATTIFAAAQRLRSPLGRGLFRLISTAEPEFRDFVAMTDAVVWTGTFAGRTDDRAYAIEVFERHNAEVRATVPAERLLVFEVAEGWEPLCRFLGVPVPDEPFPHVNDGVDFQRRQGVRMRLMARRFLAMAAPPVAVAAIGLAVLRMGRRRR